MTHRVDTDTLEQFLRDYYTGSFPHERLGQAWCNRHVTGAWPELYYAADLEAIGILTYWNIQEED